MTDKTTYLDVVLPQQASKEQALNVVEQTGLLGFGGKNKAWLEAYFAKNAKPDSPRLKDAIKVADAIYDHVSAKWLAEQFGMSIYELATDILGVDRNVECRNEDCTNVFQARFRRVKNGRKIAKYHSPRRPEEYSYLCSDCKAEYNARKKAEYEADELFDRQRREQRQAEEEKQRRLEEQRKFILRQLYPGDHPGDFLDLIKAGSENALAKEISDVALALLGKVVSVVGETNVADVGNVDAGKVRLGYHLGYHDDLRELVYPRCEKCHATTVDHSVHIQFLSRDMRLTRFSYWQRDPNEYSLREYRIAGLDALIEFGVDGFAEMVLRDWTRGLVSGRSNVMFLCDQCSPPDEVTVERAGLMFYKISPLFGEGSDDD